MRSRRRICAEKIGAFQQAISPKNPMCIGTRRWTLRIRHKTDMTLSIVIGVEDIAPPLPDIAEQVDKSEWIHRECADHFDVLVPDRRIVPRQFHALAVTH